jgi:hypothetical protein
MAREWAQWRKRLRRRRLMRCSPRLVSWRWTALMVAPAIKTVAGAYVRNVISETLNANLAEDPSTAILLGRSLYQWFSKWLWPLRGPRQDSKGPQENDGKLGGQRNFWVGQQNFIHNRVAPLSIVAGSGFRKGETCVNQQWHPNLGTLLTSHFSTQQLLSRHQLDINSKLKANSLQSVSHHLFLNITPFPAHFLTSLFMKTHPTLDTFYSTINLNWRQESEI